MTRHPPVSLSLWERVGVRGLLYIPRVIPPELKQAANELAEHGVTIDLTAFLQSRGEQVTDASKLKLADLLLAWACAEHHSPAIAYFERVYFSQASRALQRLKLSQAITEDVLGWMRFELFVRPGGPLIATYSGRGDLGSWVRSIAVHEALKRARRERKHVDLDELGELPMPEPELAAMRGAYTTEFTRALEASFQELDTPERNLLRQYFLDGLSIDVLAGLYQVHRATAARRVSAARTALVDRVKARLIKELALSEDGIEQVITLSNLNESLGALLRKTR